MQGEADLNLPQSAIEAARLDLFDGPPVSFELVSLNWINRPKRSLDGGQHFAGD